MTSIIHRRPSSANSKNEASSNVLPRHNSEKTNQPKVLGLFRVQTSGESGRNGFHPVHFLRVCFRSTCTVSMVVNILWPFVPAAIVIAFARPDLDLWVFILNYIAIVPSANLLGFAGGELARKLPKVWGILLETSLTSAVELILFMVLIKKNDHNDLISVIQAAILGSILANLLLCLGLCFFIGGLRREEQILHEAVSEVGSGLLLVAGFGLLIPSAFFSALSGAVSPNGTFTADELLSNTRKISRATAIILFAAFCMFLWYNLRTHHSIFDEVLENDENQNNDGEKERNRPKLTLPESLVAIAVSLTLVALSAVFLVENIPAIRSRGVPDNFIGLILVPLVEKAAEHLTAIDEAWDNQINFALFHCLGPSIQTALLNSPLVVIVGWGLGTDMDLNFEIFMVVMLVMSILVVGNFMRDGKSNYMEGGLCVLVYLIIAVTAWYYPNPEDGTTNVQLPAK
ncbi:vacuolar H/Ca2 exchanger [Talaromyces proteolyticus]|uniref:Vacuolar calcium ion transporter n=1 Tax=Talaromyces proteolyticus TaxID=1131652 RepID=A0AAD4PRG4_9EURO|nr:vacuolar H/Ca2 exchanger [Talaromyces proteolyticus]KAH8688816.1 vacuolar H/Ca2 exchanger [Talaromyces proteolyticus]